jgi:hypothetical protein
MPSATVTWTGNAGTSDWDTPGNWSALVVPGVTSDVVIPVGFNVTHAAASADLANTLDVEGSVTLTGGSLTILGQDVTVNGSLHLGDAVDSSKPGLLTFTSNQSLLTGAGDVVFGASPANAIQNQGANLTIDSGITIHGKNGTILAQAGDNVVNQGTIGDDVAGGTLVLTGGTWNNKGTLQAAGGGITDLQASSIANVFSGALVGGSWDAYANSTLKINASGISTNEANILLDGVGATFATDSGAGALDGLVSNVLLRSITITDGATLSTDPALTKGAPFSNSGTIFIGVGSSFTVAGQYVQSAGTTTVNGTLGSIVDSVKIEDGSLDGTGMVNAIITVTPPGTVASTIKQEKQLAAVTLSDLQQTYTGSPEAVIATTNPANLAVNITYNGSSTAPTEAGSYAVIATINDPNYRGSATSTLVIGQATPTVIVNPLNVIFDGGGHVTTGEVFGINHVDLGPAIISYSGGNAPVHAGTYTATGSFAGTNDYAATTGTATIIVGQATPTVVVQPLVVMFDGQAHGTTAEVFGVGNVDLGPATSITYSGGATPVHAGSYTATGHFSGNTDYTSATGSASVTIGKATPTVTVQPLTITFDGKAHGTTGEVFGVGHVDLGPALISYNTSDGNAPVHAGTYDATGTFVGNSDYDSATGDASITINQATPTVTVQPVTVTFDGQAHGTTGEVFGVNHVDLGPASITYSSSDESGGTPVHAGTYTATGFFPGNNDYTSATGNASITINQATPTVTVQPVNVTFDGQAHGTTGEVFGVGGADLGPANISYNTSSGSAPVHRGTYTATGSFAGNNDYTSATGTATITIGLFTPTVVVTPLTVTFDGQVHGTTAEVFGVDGIDLGPATVTYSGGSTPLHAGTYTATGTFAGNNDYTSATGSASITINQATPTVTVTPVTATFDAQTHGTTGEVFGVNHVDLGAALISYSGGSTPLHAGTYTATGTFAGNNDYTGATGNASITINQATPTVTVQPVTVTFDGQAHGTTGEVFGVNHVDLGAALISYSGGSTPLHAGTYTATGTFAGNNDYTGATGSASITINQATPTVTVQPVTVTFDGQAHGTTGEVFGVNHVDLGAALISYSGGSTPLHAGTYTATGTFAGNNDYTSATGSASISINQAKPTVTVQPVNVTFDGQAHGTTGEVFGVGGADLGPAIISYNTSDGSAPVHRGSYTATGTFAGNNDYTSATGTATISIGLFTPTVVVKPVTVTFDGQVHGTTAEVFGVNGIDLGPATSIGYSGGSTPLHAGTYTATGSFAGNSDYTSATGSASITINQATPTVVVQPVTVTFDNHTHGTTAEVFGVGNADLGPATSIGYTGGSTPLHAGSYTATGSFAGNNDYTSATGTAAVTINQATPTVTVQPLTATFDGQTHGTTGEVFGVNHVDLGAALISYTGGSTPLHAGTYTATGSFAGNNDYTSATGAASVTINQATPTVTVQPVNVTFDDQAHGTTGEVFGVGNVDLGPASISYSTSGGGAPIHAGSYTATGSFAGNNDYTSATGSASIIIGQATPTVTVQPVNVTFDGQAHGTTGEVFGVNNFDLGPATISYTGGSTPVHAGSYTATGSFGGDNDYTSAIGSAAIIIGQATPTVTVTPISVTFDAKAHGTTGEVFGVGNIDLGPATISYNTSGGGAPIHAGSYIATASFAGNNDYTTASNTASINIAQATPNVVVNSVTATFDAKVHGTTGEVFGVGNVHLGAAAITYSSGSAPAHAGNYTATGTFAGNADYTSATGSASITINQATPSVTVIPVTATFDGQSHGTTAEAFGVGHLDLGPAVVSYNTGDGNAPVHAGTYTATGFYAGSNDYVPVIGNAAIVINQATPTVVVQPVTVTFDGQPHGTTGEVFGVGGADLGAAVISYSTADGSAPVQPGGYTATGNFAGNNDYTSASGNATINVDVAPTFTGAQTATFTEGSLGTTFIIHTAGGFPLPMSLTENGTLPAGVIFTDNHDGTATLSGKPADGSGGKTYTFSVTAASAAGNSTTDTFAVDVLSPREAASAVSSQTVIVGPDSGPIPPVVVPGVSGSSANVSLSVPSTATTDAALSVTTYSKNPLPQANDLVATSSTTPQTLGTDSVFMDVRVVGVSDPNGTSVTATFIFPPTVTTAQLASFQLLYRNGDTWQQVLSDPGNGHAPVVPTPTFDSTLGRYTITVRFGPNSSPGISALTGTVFTLALATAAPTVTTPIEPPQVLIRLPNATDSGNGFASAATFASNSQVSLVLRVSNDSELTASRTALSTDVGVGGIDYSGDLDNADLPWLKDVPWLWEIIRPGGTPRTAGTQAANSAAPAAQPAANSEASGQTSSALPRAFEETEVSTTRYDTDDAADYDLESPFGGEFTPPVIEPDLTCSRQTTPSGAWGLPLAAAALAVPVMERPRAVRGRKYRPALEGPQ